jgi:hypothetical protein
MTPSVGAVDRDRCPLGSFILNLFPLRRTSWYYSYHSLLGTQIVQCTPTPEDHLAPLPFTPGIFVLCCSLLSRCLGIFSRGLVLSALDSHGLSSLDSRGPLSIPIGLHGLYSFNSFGSFSWTIVGSSDSHGLFMLLIPVHCSHGLLST